MELNNAPGDNKYGRRRFLGGAGVAALSVGAAQLGLIGPAFAQGAGTETKGLPVLGAGALKRFGPSKQIDAGVLNVGYVDVGPVDGPAVLLLHGFPYDIHTFVEVAPLLASQGYRAIVPYIRGHGTTNFLSPTTPRNVDQAAMALDTIALMDALHIDSAILAGFDLGTRTANIIAALWPERVKAQVAVTGYLITNLVAQTQPVAPNVEFAFWYQYYFSTERGVLGLMENGAAIGELIWKFNSPTWNFDQATYDRTAQAFTNPDWVNIIIGNYRWRLGLYPSEREYVAIEARLQESPKISVPTITIDGQYDPFTPPGDGALYRDHFVGKYQHRTFPVGHNVPQEAPREFTKAVVDVAHL